MAQMRLKRLIVGEPLSNFHAQHEKISNFKALSTLSSDALSSVAYATDSILYVLAAASAAFVIWSIPLALAIIALLVILTLSYRQVIEAYPGGGGAYMVAKENLGQTAGLVAGAALLIDYVLTVSVSVSAGVENIASAFPNLAPHSIGIGVCVVIVITLMNLRGVRESATVFSFPTYFFIFSVFVLVGVGFFRAMTGSIPSAAPVIREVYPSVSILLLLRAFAAGCTALTGVEAISNSVTLFKEPAPRNAMRTMAWMAIILGSMFLGITMLAHMLHIVPNPDQTLMSLLGRAVFGNSFAYYALQGATALILFLAANTSYAGFPRLASLLARDRYLPRQLMSLGDRLVFSNGIVGLSVAATVLIIMFQADVGHLLPLYAVGVFLSFTLAQAGMVVYHLKRRQSGWMSGLIVNALGTVTAAVVLLDIGYARFTHGAWIVVAAIPVMIIFFKEINRHYLSVGRELSQLNRQAAADFKKIKHTVVVPVSGIHQGVKQAIEYALSISEDVRCCYVDLDTQATQRMEDDWKRWAPHIPFVVLKSPYRSVIEPLIRYVDDVEQTCHDDVVTVVIPEFITAKWWHQLLHNHTAIWIRAALTFRRRKVVTSVRYHLKGF